MSNIEMIQKLLKDKADLQALINISVFDGSFTAMKGIKKEYEKTTINTGYDDLFNTCWMFRRFQTGR